jgi:hypothetical protein
MKVLEALAEALAAEGIDHIFAVMPKLSRFCQARKSQPSFAD